MVDRQQSVLRALGSLSYRAGDLETYLREIADAVASLTRVHWVAITLCTDGWERVLASTLDPEPDPSAKAVHGEVTDFVARTGSVVVVEDIHRDASFGTMPAGYRAYLGVPLRTARGLVLGTVCSFSREPRTFDDEDRRAAELFANRAATAIDNYLLYEELSGTNAGLEREIARRTEEIRLAHEKLVMQERLAAIGEFAATVVHELRNPLTTIVLSLSLIERLGVPAEARPSLRTAFEEATRLDRRVRELLEYAKPCVLDLQHVNISALCREVADGLQALPELEGRSVEIFSSASDVATDADPEKLRQVVTNLLLNAIEATPRGERIRCYIEAVDASVVLRVLNGGPPIPPHDLPRLTEPFFTTKPNGTGLGLPLVKRIVQAHGGTLQIDSDTERGTCVTVSLPPLRPTNQDIATPAEGCT
jgi:signal transduction histidine kinase